MGEIVVRRLKERGAEYYRETRNKILAEMVGGNVIHADETIHVLISCLAILSTLRTLDIAQLWAFTRGCASTQAK